MEIHEMRWGGFCTPHPALPRELQPKMVEHRLPTSMRRESTELLLSPSGAWSPQDAELLTAAMQELPVLLTHDEQTRVPLGKAIVH